MFSSLFGKKRSSPVEDETPPIPGPKNDDSFVIVDSTSPGGNLYPSISGSPYGRPAPAPPVAPMMLKVDQHVNYLQGVPFTLSKELEMTFKKDVYFIEIGEVLTFLLKKQRLKNYKYDFALEKSVLKEC